MAGRLQHLGEAAILALLDGRGAEVQPPPPLLPPIAIPQLLTKSPLPLGNNNYNPIMSTYLGPRMKLICFYLRLVRGGGPPIPLKHNYDHNNHQVSPLLTHTCLGTDKLKHNRSIHFLDAIGGNKYNFSTWFFLTNELPQP